MTEKHRASGEYIDVMLAQPGPIATLGGDVLEGAVGDVVPCHWAEAQNAAGRGLVVLLDDLQALAEVHA